MEVAQTRNRREEAQVQALSLCNNSFARDMSTCRVCVAL
jgi:hypothetical protein